MTSTEIRETLTTISDAVPVPAVDEVAFRAKVRRERRGRTTGRVLVAGVAASVVAAGTTYALGVGGDDERVLEPATPTVAFASVPETVWFVRDGNLTALDPRGVVHDLHVASEAVIGFTSERVFALDDDSHVVVRRVEYADDGSASFAEETAPVDGAVGSVALSGDGRYLAWADVDGSVHRYDLKADHLDLEFDGGPNPYVADVSAAGVLVSEDGDLVLRSDRGEITVPTQGGGAGWAAQVADGRVLVADRDGRSRLYDVRGGAAQLVETLPGFGVLGPYAERVALIAGDPDSPRLDVWDGGPADATAFDAVPDSVRWADEETLLVAAHQGATSLLYACDIDRHCALLPVDGEVNLSE